MAWRVALFLGSFLVLCGATVLFPGIDLVAAALFYEPLHGFFLSDWAPIRFIRAAMPYLTWGIVLAGLLLLSWRRRRAGLLLLLALAMGTGLLVHFLFKG
jgi:hypothetical protein